MMPQTNKIFKLVFISTIALLVSVFISAYIFPTYFSGDDADMLVGAKYFSKHIVSIFSIFAPQARISTVSPMLMWHYYRPLERLLWTVYFIFFGINPVPLHVIEIFLFIITLYNLFRITSYLSALPSKTPSFLCVLILLTLFYPFNKALLTFLSHSNTILMLFFLSASLNYLFLAYHKEDQKRMLWGIFFALLAFLSKEWALYALPSLLIIYFYLKWQESTIIQKRIILKTSAFIFLSLTIMCILQFLFRRNAYSERMSNLLNAEPFLFHFQYFLSAGKTALPLFILSLFSLAAFRNKGQITVLLWSAITLIPALLYKNLYMQSSLHYMALTVIGLSIFMGISLYLLINESYELITRRMRMDWYKDKYSSALLLLFRQLVLLPVVLCYVAIFSLSGYKDFKSDIKYFSENFRRQKQNFEKAYFSRKNSIFFVTGELKKTFYAGMLQASGRGDVTIDILNSEAAGLLKSGENLIKNSGFESDFEGWRIDYKGVFRISDTVFFSGSKSMEIDLESLSKFSDNFVELRQQVKVKPGQIYLFGGWINASSGFNGHFCIEIRDIKGWQYANYKASLIKEPDTSGSGWNLIQNYFIPATEDLLVIACRGSAPTKGKIYIDGIFLYPIKNNLLD
jgi:hypothetical protein